jgi:AraC family transcriptional regulator, transcriptional activator of pobA
LPIISIGKENGTKPGGFVMDKSIKVRRLERKYNDYTDKNNYQIFWMANGLNSIKVDFEKIPFYQNSILFLTPGRVVTLDFSDEPPKGWILNFTKEYFRKQYLDGLIINNIDLLDAYGEIPRIVLSPKIGDRINYIAEMIAELAGSEIPNREYAISSLLKTLLVYCESKCNLKPVYYSNKRELNLVSLFKHLVSQNYQQLHQVSGYADMLNVSPKYLNQVVKRVMGVTAKSVIQEQLIIHACRDLKFSNESVKEIAFKLGFSESEHFSNFFKKGTKQSPTIFRNN